MTHKTRTHRSGECDSAPVKQTRVGAAMLLVAALSACSGITDPYVSFGVDKDNKPQTIPQDPSFAEAKTIARHAVDNFQKRATSLEEFDVATGALMVGAGLAGIAIGVFDGGVNALYGAGLAGAVAGSGRAFLPISTRKQVYFSGSSAINCAIVSIGMGESDTPPNRPDSAADLTGNRGASRQTGPFTTIADELLRVTAQGPSIPSAAGFSGTGAGSVDLLASSTTLFGAANSEQDPAVKAIMSLSAVQMQTAGAAMAESRDKAFELAMEIYSAVHTRGERLINSTELIINAVNKKIENASITPDASLEAAKTAASAFKKNVEEAAEVLKATSESGEAEAKATKASLMAVAAVPNKASSSNDPIGSSLADAAKEEAIARKLKSQAEKVLELLEVSDSCLDGLK